MAPPTASFSSRLTTWGGRSGILLTMAFLPSSRAELARILSRILSEKRRELRQQLATHERAARAVKRELRALHSPCGQTYATLRKRLAAHGVATAPTPRAKVVATAEKPRKTPVKGTQNPSSGSTGAGASAGRTRARAGTTAKPRARAGTRSPGAVVPRKTAPGDEVGAVLKAAKRAGAKGAVVVRGKPGNATMWERPAYTGMFSPHAARPTDLLHSVSDDSKGAAAEFPNGVTALWGPTYDDRALNVRGRNHHAYVDDWGALWLETKPGKEGGPSWRANLGPFASHTFETFAQAGLRALKKPVKVGPTAAERAAYEAAERKREAEAMYASLRTPASELTDPAFAERVIAVAKRAPRRPKDPTRATLRAVYDAGNWDGMTWPEFARRVARVRDRLALSRWDMLESPDLAPVRDATEIPAGTGMHLITVPD